MGQFLLLFRFSLDANILSGCEDRIGTLTSLRIVRPKIRGSIPNTDKIFILFPKHPDWHWGPILPPMECVTGNFLSMVKRSGRVTDYSHHLMPSLRMSGAILHSPLCLYGVHRDNFSFTLLYWL